MRFYHIAAFTLFLISINDAPSQNFPQFSGIYPHLATYNQENECGTGAVVVWAERLWAISYGPHRPFGSTDKLYEIDSQLNQTIRPESIGGTHANRMIHPESQQLFIGGYVIDNDRNVRIIHPDTMPGRLTGNARHLTDSENKIYFASMEEGFYEVDVNTLDVKTINLDGNAMTPPNVSGPLLPGYHGKGFFSSQGRLVYANNGENSSEARMRPDIVSGCLAEWDGVNWNIIRRNQFTEVTGPGGISGNENTDDPLWSVGWDDKSLILMLLDDGKWSAFRLPKASHTYDGAHGWNTEWPRIRDIGEDALLMTMHGMFWKFPRSFSNENQTGIQPLSSYLKIIGDFCEWNGKVVFGCDDAAKSDFRSNGIFDAHGPLAGQSNSNLWFVDPGELGQFGPAIGRGGPWKKERVEKNVYSAPFLFDGFDHRMVHITHGSDAQVNFVFEISDGLGRWKEIYTTPVSAKGYAHHIFSTDVKGQWIRVKTDRDCDDVTLIYQFSDADKRSSTPDPIFDGFKPFDQPHTGGIIRARGEDKRTLHYAVTRQKNQQEIEALGYYEIGADLNLKSVNDPATHKWLIENNDFGKPLFTMDDASILVVDSMGKRYRLPKGAPSLQHSIVGEGPRIMREVVTERSLFNAQGNWYELPRQNAGGFSKIRPVSSTELYIDDFCSWRGMMVLSGLSEAHTDNPHVIRSDDSQCSLWFGTIDDLWKLGKPRGVGGVWYNSLVEKSIPSDAYLMTGYDQKSLAISHQSDTTVTFEVEVDITGDGDWCVYGAFEVNAGQTFNHKFPTGFNAYWCRVKASDDVQATATFTYR